MELQETLNLTKFTVRFRPFNDEKNSFVTEEFFSYEIAKTLMIGLMDAGFEEVTFYQK